MKLSDRIQTYSSLLETRKRLIRWNVVLLGGIFLVSILFTLAYGLVIGLSGRSVYLVTGIEIALGIGFLMAWVRLEIVRSSIDLLNNLQP